MTAPNYTPWILAGGALFLLTDAGGKFVDAASRRLKGFGDKIEAPATPKAPVKDQQLPVKEAQNAGSTATVPTGGDSPQYKAFRARLPTNDLNAQIWVQAIDGNFRYVSAPAEYGKYGIKADESNVVDVPWPSRVFQSTTYLTDPSETFWVRSDTPSGIDGNYPQVPYAMFSALRDAYNARKIVPVSVTGYAVLKQQGVL